MSLHVLGDFISGVCAVGGASLGGVRGGGGGAGSVLTSSRSLSIRWRRNAVFGAADSVEVYEILACLLNVWNGLAPEIQVYSSVRPLKTCGFKDSVWAKRSLAVAIEIKLGSWTEERKKTTGSGHVYTDLWDSYQVMQTVNVIRKACVYRSIALCTCHMH